MKIHEISVEKAVLDNIIHNDRDFIIVEQNGFEKGDLINFKIKYYDGLLMSLYVFQIKEVITDDALKDNYCILEFKQLK